MKKNDFNYYIKVSKLENDKREINYGVNYNLQPLLNELNFTFLSNINKAIELEKQIKKGDFLYGYDQLQSQRVVFELYKNTSIIDDFIFENKVEIETDIVFDFLKKYKYFIEKEYSEGFLGKVLKAFKTIQMERNAYRTEIKNLFVVEVATDIFVHITLNEQDFLIGESYFKKTLVINDVFLK